MAEPLIQVTLSAMEGCSKSFTDCSEKLIEIAQTLSTASLAMSSVWSDSAQVKFEASFEEMIEEFDKAYSCLCAMSSFSSYVAELYTATDRAVKGLL